MSDIITNSGMVNLSNNLAQPIEQVFPFMSLPYEIRNKIYRFAAVKPDGHIGQADETGVRCTLGAQMSYNGRAILSADSLEYYHFPAGCRHPMHENEQIFQDYRDYRCMNLALTCRQVYEEVTTVFFKGNGFELRDPAFMVDFLLLIGPYRANLIPKLRLYYNINLSLADVENIFGNGVVSNHALYCTLELDHLHDDEPNSKIVQILKYIKCCQRLKDFELVYRLEAPGDHFAVSRARAIAASHPLYTNIAYSWHGESVQWEIHTENVLAKLRQDSGVANNHVVDVDMARFKTNGLAKVIATVLGRQEEFHERAVVLRLACLAHAENCIEFAGADEKLKRIMGVA